LSHLTVVLEVIGRGWNVRTLTDISEFSSFSGARPLFSFLNVTHLSARSIQMVLQTSHLISLTGSPLVRRRCFRFVRAGTSSQIVVGDPKLVRPELDLHFHPISLHLHRVELTQLDTFKGVAALVVEIT
jgi:hypothetical protein